MLPRFQDVFTIPRNECDAVGNSWAGAIETIPEGQQPAPLLKLIEGLPWVEAFAITGLVFGPRFTFVLANWRSRSQPQPQNGKIYSPRDFAGDPRGDPPNAPPPIVDAPPPPPGDGGFPSPYTGERGQEYAELDGTAAAEN